MFKREISTFILVGLVAFCFMLIMSMVGCAMSEKQLIAKVKADMWLHEKIPAEICEREPELKKIGVYRVITCTDAARKAGKCGAKDATYDEYVSYCNITVEKHWSMHQTQLDKWIDQLRKALKEE